MALVHAADIATLAGAGCYILLPARYNLRDSSHIWDFDLRGPGILYRSLTEASVIC
jgi:hypothetical protein